ncbi:MAG: HAD family hydrolase [Alphaproteobacteria bacterium]|nr:HAD family hydrolase [Alphaproteobacteria bacterium]
MKHYSSSTPEAILFDWDNTLVDSWPCIHIAFNKAFVAMDKPEWTLEQLKSNVGLSLRDIFPKLFGDKWEEAKEIYLKSFDEIHIDMLSPFEGIEQMFIELRKHVKFIGIISNKTSIYLNREIKHLGWHKYFDAVVGANQAEKDKPDVAPVLMALEGTGLEMPYGNKVWFIGDNEVDIECAAKIGCTSVLVRPEPPLKNEFLNKQPDLYLKDCTSLLQCIVE